MNITLSKQEKKLIWDKIIEPAITKEYNEIKKNWLAKSNEEIFNSCWEISSLQHIYNTLTTDSENYCGTEDYIFCLVFIKDRIISTIYQNYISNDGYTNIFEFFEDNGFEDIKKAFFEEKYRSQVMKTVLKELIEAEIL